MLKPSDITTPALAYLGDCVLEMCVRRYLVLEAGYSTSAHLNKEALQYVCAPKQSKAMAVIEPYLTEHELAVYKRGRNTLFKVGYGMATPEEMSLVKREETSTNE